MKRIIILLFLCSIPFVGWSLSYQGKSDFVIDLGGKTVSEIVLFDCHNVIIQNGSVKGISQNLIHLNGCTEIEIRNVKLDGYGFVRNCMAIVASHMVTVRDSSFRNAYEEVVRVDPGHPWGRLDAEVFGYEYVPGASFKRGVNVLAFSGDQYQDRRGFALDGIVTSQIIKDHNGWFWRSEFRTENQKPTDLTWYVWDGVKTVTGQVVSLTEDEVKIEADIPNGEVVWYAIDTRFMNRNIYFYDCEFSGSKGNSGLTIYGTNGFIVKDCVTFNTRDYGLGAEWSRDGVFIGNAVSGTGDAWNRVEGVYFLENVAFHDTQVGFRSHGAPQINCVAYAPARIEVGDGVPGRKVYWLDNLRTFQQINQKEAVSSDGLFKPGKIFWSKP